ncbi:APC family permease [Saccharopolyspora gloriosae]|uniref:APC family permease n=1 Tax=Saccharopolyspora gloriosae TaxID=455344 RepID=UPI001FB5BDE4|nr:APC family permease [Saccharopolyspora gloriosae]
MRRNDGNGEPVALGRGQQLALALGGVLGAGWVTGVPATAELHKSNPSWYIVVLPWLVGLAVIGLVAAILVRLARTDPRSGGLAWWPQDRSGRVVGTVINAGLFTMYAGNPPAGALITVLALDRTLGGMGWTEEMDGGWYALTWPGALVALIVLTALFLVHIVGGRVMLRMNLALSAVKALLLLMLVGNAAIAQYLLLPKPLDGGGQQDAYPLAMVSVITAAGMMFAFTGFQGPVDNGDRSGKDHRGFAIYGALIIATLIYIGLQVVFSHGVAESWEEPVPGSTGFVVRAVATVLSPMTNALLFIYLAAIVLKTSADQSVLKLPRLNMNRSLQVLLVVYLFGVALLLVMTMLGNWPKVTDAKSVIFLFVYSYAAIAYRASWNAQALQYPELDPRGGRLLAPASFVVTTVIMFCTGFATMLWAYALVGVVAAVMFWSRFSETDHNRAEHFRRARWLFGYVTVLLVLACCHFAVRYQVAEAPPGFVDVLLGSHDLRPFEDLLFIDGFATLVFAVVVAGAGLLFHRLGVREAESFIRFKNGSAG